jgi:serine/threonine protein kinase
MQIIQHPLILGFKEYFQTKKHIYIITEYVSGVNLFEEVKKYEVLEEYDAAKVAQMIIVGVSYMHSMEIIHRDLKPENIMVSGDLRRYECSNQGCSLLVERYRFHQDY